MPLSSPSRAASAFALCTVVFASCAVHRSPGPARAPATAATVTPLPVETRIGFVRAVGPEQRFVLIETPSALAASALVEGQTLHIRPPDALTRAATADLRVSRERQQTLVVANVVAGDPEVGAVVYATPHPLPAASPVPGSISSVATAPLSGLGTPRQP